MADMVTRQELEAAKVDVKHAGEAVNAKKVITPRYGNSFKSIPLLSEELQQILNNKDLEAGQKLQALQDTINIALAAGAGAAGWTASLVADASGKSQQEINDSTFRVNAKLLGIVPFLDATAQLEHYLNDSVTHEIYLPSGQYTVSDTIVVDAPIPKKIYGEKGTTFKTNFATSKKVFDIKSQLDFERLAFDFSNNHCLNAIFYNNGYGLVANLKDITLKNLDDKNINSQSYLIYTNTDTRIDIQNIRFENIKKQAGTSDTEETGLVCGIMCSSLKDSVGAGGVIDNVTTDVMMNTNALGARVPTGGAKTIQCFSSGGFNPVKISNVSGKDFGRRLVKIQASGVTATNISGETQFDDTLTVIASQSDGDFISSGNRLKNITANGKIKYACVVTSDDTDVDGLYGDISSDSLSSRGVYFAKGKGIRYKNIDLTCPNPIFFDLTNSDVQDCEVINATFKLKQGSGYAMIGSNPDEYGIKGLKLQNLTFDTNTQTSVRSVIVLTNTGMNSDFEIRNITLKDKLSASNRNWFGSIKNVDRLNIDGITYIPEGGVHVDPLVASDLLLLTDVKNWNINNVTWSNRFTRGIYVRSSPNGTIGSNINFPYTANTGHILVTTSGNIALASELSRYKLFLDSASSVIHRGGVESARSKNGFIGQVYYNTTRSIAQICTASAVIATDGTIATPAVWSDSLATLQASTVYNPPALAPNERTPLQIFTVTGATTANAVVMSYNQDLQGVSLVGYISAANTVTYYFENRTAASVDLNGGTVTVKVL